MVTREWSERHIVELIKKNGGGAGDPMVTVAVPTMNYQASKTPTVIRAVLTTINSQEGTYAVDPVATYYTVDNVGSAATDLLVPSNFPVGDPFAGFMWPREIQGKRPNFPFSFSRAHTLQMLAARATGTDYVRGSASFRARSSFHWGSNMTFSSNPDLSGVWGGITDDYQRFYALEIMNTGVRDLVQDFVDTFGENPAYVTAWHVNSPVPIP